MCGDRGDGNARADARCKHPACASTLFPTQRAVEAQQQGESAQRLAKILRSIGPGNRRQPKEQPQPQPRAVTVLEPNGGQPKQRCRERRHHAVPEQRALQKAHADVEQGQQPQEEVPGHREERRRRALLAVDLTIGAKRTQNLARAVDPLRPRDCVRIDLGALTDRFRHCKKARLVHNVKAAGVCECIYAEEQRCENQETVKSCFVHAVQCVPNVQSDLSTAAKIRGRA